MLRLMLQALKVAAVGVLALSVVFTTQAALSHYLDRSNSVNEEITFVVEEQETVDSVAQRLDEAELIRWPTYFKIKMRLSNADSKLKSGQFTLRKGMSVNDIIEALTTAENIKVVEVRFQEGWRTEQYAEKLVEVGLLNTTDEFMNVVKNGQWNYDFLSTRPSEADLEGFLFPDTYQFRADATPEDMINILLDNFGTRLAPEERAKAEALGYNLFQVITVASIIEREAVVAEERPIIASVYYNRLKDNHPLEADPTAQYALGQPGAWWPPLEQDPRQVQSPYNTYLNPGLPPRPICNPSLASIKAALNPATTDYYFFVAKGDDSGAHFFSKTYEEHLQNIEKARQGQP